MQSSVRGFSCSADGFFTNQMNADFFFLLLMDPFNISRFLKKTIFGGAFSHNLCCFFILFSQTVKET